MVFHNILSQYCKDMNLTDDGLLKEMGTAWMAAIRVTFNGSISKWNPVASSDLQEDCYWTNAI